MPKATLTRAFFALLLAGGGVAFAAEPPELAEVRGVPAGDTLTVRAEPSAQAAAVGALAEGAGPIEILETATTGATEWARIPTSEGSGWAARRYLAAVEVPRLGQTRLTVGLSCGGTEPFWGLEILSQSEAVWRNPSTGEEIAASIEESVGAAARGGWPAAVILAGENFSGVLTAAPGACSDGMSDRAYPWAATLLDLSSGRAVLYEGCCGHPPPM